jgi:predicted dehydrogenase
MSCGMDGDVFKAFLNIDGSGGTMRIVNPLAPHMGHVLEIRADGESRKETVEGPSTFAAQLAAVVAALRDGNPFPLASDDPVHSMAAIDAVKAAARLE